MSACNAASKVNLQKHPPRGSASLVREGGCEVNDGLCRSRLERARTRARGASFFAECFISASSHDETENSERNSSAIHATNNALLLNALKVIGASSFESLNEQSLAWRS